MADIKIKKLNKFYGDLHIIKDIDIEIEDKSFTVLVGPSGSGKSTMLRMIAGLEEINSGEISIDDKIVNKLDPKDREIAMVFQSYALYPHMNVFDNMALGLKLKKTPKDDIKKKVHEAAKILQLEDYLDRLPKQLSGGQRQRVAIGRAITRDPKIFLFDEPLSNLDAKLRVEMRRELKKLHQNLKTTMVYVTHDQTEAMTLGTKIALMNNGRIEQYDTPTNIYNNPKSVFVADFVGSPPMNFIKGKIIDENNKKSFLPDSAESKFKILVDNKDLISNNTNQVLLGVRPEHIFFKKEHAVRVSKDDNFAEIKVTPILNEYVGHEQIITFDYLGQEVLGKFSSSISIDIGKEIILYIDLNKICFFDQ